MCGWGRSRQLDYTAWCEGIRAGRSYVSDGYAHAVEFQVNGVRPGEGDVKLAAAGQGAESSPRSLSPRKRRWPSPMAASRRRPAASVVGDTVELHGPRYEEMLRGGKRLVEIVVNGQRGRLARRSQPTARFTI